MKIFLKARGIKIVTSEKVKIVSNPEEADLIIADKDFGNEDEQPIIYVKASLSDRVVGIKGVGDFDVLSVPVTIDTLFVDGLFRNKAGNYAFISNDTQYPLKESENRKGVIFTKISVDLTGTGAYEKKEFALVVGENEGFAFAKSSHTNTTYVPPVAQVSESNDLTSDVMDILSDMDVDPPSINYVPTQIVEGVPVIKGPPVTDDHRPWEDGFDTSGAVIESLDPSQLNDPNALTQYGDQLL